MNVRLFGKHGERRLKVTARPIPTLRRASGEPRKTESIAITPDLPKAETIATPVSDNPLGDELNALIAEADELLNPSPRVNTSTEICGHHYVEPPSKKGKTNYDAPLVTWWNAEMHRRSDAEMAYRRSARRCQVNNHKLETLEYATDELTRSNMEAQTLLTEFGLEVENAELDGIDPPTEFTDDEKRQLKSALTAAREAVKVLTKLNGGISDE